jgi:hypothetical protein
LIDKEQAAREGRISTLEIVGLSQRFLKHAPCRRSTQFLQGPY